MRGQPISRSAQSFATLRAAFKSEPALRQEVEWAYRLAVETYNPSDRGLRFITGGIGEWIITLSAYKAGIVTIPAGHGANSIDTVDLLAQAKGLWSVKTSYKSGGYFTITNGQNGPGLGLVVPTIFLSPGLSGIVFVEPCSHPNVVREVTFGKGETKLKKEILVRHASANLECVIPFDMPVNPGAPITDPALEAVKLLVNSPQFPRLGKMFQDSLAGSDNSVVNQIKSLMAMRSASTITEEQFAALVAKVAGQV